MGNVRWKMVVLVRSGIAGAKRTVSASNAKMINREDVIAVVIAMNQLVTVEKTIENV